MLPSKHPLARQYGTANANTIAKIVTQAGNGTPVKVLRSDSYFINNLDLLEIEFVD